MCFICDLVEESEVVINQLTSERNDQRYMYYPFMDYYITELTARLLENGGRYQAQHLIPMNLPRLTPDTVDVIFDTYKTHLRCDIVMF
jgi:hypothetical protein